MAVDHAASPTLDDLDRRELRALTEAAAWYAKYHEQIISNAADDPSAAAIVRREQYTILHAALWKLGVRLRRPDGL